LVTLYQQHEFAVKFSKERNDDFDMSLNLLEIEFQVVEWRLRWNEFCLKLQNDRANIFQFSPQSFITSRSVCRMSLLAFSRRRGFCLALWRFLPFSISYWIPTLFPLINQTSYLNDSFATWTSLVHVSAQSWNM
jgi:hypothetical protein